MPPTQAAGDQQFYMHWGWTTPAQWFGMSAMRYLRDTGATTKTFAEVAVAHRYHASLNPKAIMRAPITIEDHQRSRWVSKPLRLLDCCLETDVSAAIIITSRERAFDLKQPPFSSGRHGAHHGSESVVELLPVQRFTTWRANGRNRLFGMAGISQKDVDFISCYDAFTFTTTIQLEAYGFCGKGEAKISSKADVCRLTTNCRPTYPAGICPKVTRTALAWSSRTYGNYVIGQMTLVHVGKKASTRMIARLAAAK